MTSPNILFFQLLGIIKYNDRDKNRPKASIQQCHATIVFGMIEDVSVIFWICAGVSIVGSVFTVIFSCDLTKVSLVEHDAQLELFMDGRLDEYKGLLNAPQHLSNYELWVGRHGEYDPHWANKFVVEEEKSGVEAN